MSSSGPRREVAYRVFADEFNDAHHTYAESDEERAPNYLVTPTGARVNRLFVVGVLTEIEEVSDDVLRARVVDPTGAFVIYAGQYQPEALAFFERAEPPSFVAVTGKARTFQPEGSERVFTSIRPETVNEVDADTRDRWVVQTAEHTLERVAIFAKALESGLEGGDLQDALAAAGVKPGVAAGVPRAIEAYGTTTGYLASIQSMAVDAARLVANEIEAVERDPLEPDEGDDAPVDTSFADDVVITPAAASEEPAPAEAATSDSAVDEQPSEGVSEPTTPDLESDESAEETAEAPPADETTEVAGDGEADQETPTTAAEEPTAADLEDTSPPDDEVSPTAETAGEQPAEEAFEETDADSVLEAEPDAEAADTAETTDEMYELSEAERREVEENFDVGFESGAEIGEPESGDEPAADSGAEGDAQEPEDAPESQQEEAVEDGDTDRPDEEQTEPSEPEGDLTDVREGGRTEDEDEEAPESEDEPGAEDAPRAEDVPETEDEPESEDEPAAEDKRDADHPDGDVPEGDELEDVVIEVMQSEAGGDGIEREVLVEHVNEEYGASDAAIEDAIQDALLGGRCFESGEDQLKPI